MLSDSNHLSHRSRPDYTGRLIPLRSSQRSFQVHLESFCMASRNPSSWMWAEACEMLERAQRLQRQFFQFGHAVEAQPRWEPPVDIVAYEL